MVNKKDYRNVKLKEICTLINGRAYKREELLESGKYPVLRVGNFFSKSDWFYSDMELPDDKYCDNGDLLFAWSASFGPKIWDGGKVIFHYHIWKMILSDSLYRDYFYYYLLNESQRIKSDGNGAIMMHTTKGKMEEKELSLPQIDEQRRIAEVLSRVERVIENKRLQLKEYDHLIKSRFVEMFGDENNSKKWDVTTINEVADVRVGVVIKPAQYYTDEHSGVKAFRSLNVGELKILDKDWVYFNSEGNEINARSILKENDILIVRSGAPGKSCVITKEYEGCNAIDVIIAHADENKVNPHYLSCFTNFPHGKKQIIEGTGGAAQQHFNVGRYKDMKLMLPPLKLQNEYVEFLKHVDKLKVEVQKSLNETQMLFDSLMYKYFNNKVDE